MASSRKKVIVRTATNAVLPGYLPPAGIVEAGSSEAEIHLLDLEGRIAPIALATVRWVAYVRDFNLGDREDPERLTRLTFLARPRAEGLWVRLTLAGGDQLEGLAPLDLSLVDALIEDRGLFLIPPDIRSNTQRLYIPRTAFTDLQIVGVITTPSKSSPLPKAPAGSRPQQDLLFPDPARR
jgi:hypothetical protein